MIPLQLRLRNFMCYRDNVPPLRFEGIHLACLSGANGHGKSALLDAMTWALWGKARARRDDDLIHIGQSEMEVEFTFGLGGIVYRVLRKRDSTKRGRTLLDLQVQHDGEFRSIAEPTVRETQAAIIRLLRMDYETFTNSAFLLQGKADAFTTRTPAERKRVLGEIMGLSLYDEYEQRAKGRAREKERQLTEIEGSLREMDRELARQPEYEAELAQAQAQAQEVGTELKEAEAELRAQRAEQQHLEHQQARLRDLDRRLADLQRELEGIAAQIEEHGQRLADYEAVLATRQQVEEGYQAWQQARQAEASWNQKLARHARLQQDRHELERAIEAARADLERQRSGLQERARSLEQAAARIQEYQEQLAAQRSELEKQAERQTEREAAQKRLQALAEESAGLKVRNDQMLDEMKALREKLDMLEREANEVACPLCGQQLTDDHRQRLLTEMVADGEALRDAHQANTARRHEIAAETKRLKEHIQQIERELAAEKRQRRREAQLEQALAGATQAAEELKGVQADLADLERRLTEGDFAPEEQAKLAPLVEEMEALGYDPAAHEAARADTASLARFEAEYQRLQAALQGVDGERAALKDLTERQGRWQEMWDADRAQRESLVAEVERLPAVQEQVKEQQQKVADVQLRSSKARQAVGAAEQKLDHCRHLREERQRYETERQKRAEEKAVYEELRLAFGKKGIQAMIIEAAIPEIEYEANQLLARMTEGRMHIRFETQRETLKGDTVETLDINIADELGTRPYDLFSGGEAFRVNFAIRIALSKLLARRAGAQLQMLVIDEGFGTQDAEGRQRLVEAINSIQDDFARILVITHIEELKDAFPVHIEVVKTAAGSQFSLS